jgi:hypothetical protein
MRNPVVCLRPWQMTCTGPTVYEMTFGWNYLHDRQEYFLI